MNVAFANQLNKLQLLENTYCHCDQGLERSYNYSISFHSQKTSESGNWHLERYVIFLRNAKAMAYQIFLLSSHRSFTKIQGSSGK